jgi:hypothetical protein
MGLLWGFFRQRYSAGCSLFTALGLPLPWMRMP